MNEENEIFPTARIVKSHDIRIDTTYAEWIAELKHRYRSAQVKASVRVNAEKLLFNWELGRDLVQFGIGLVSIFGSFLCSLLTLHIENISNTKFVVFLIICIVLGGATLVLLSFGLFFGRVNQRL